MDLEIGQVLWLKVRYKTDVIAKNVHPMLVAIINIDENKIEVIAIDKARDKISQLYNEANYFLDSENPKEKVIYVDSYAQLNNTLTIEYFPELIQFRKTKEKLSSEKLIDLINDYQEYHKNNFIPDERKVHMSKTEILNLNKDFNNP